MEIEDSHKGRAIEVGDLYSANGREAARRNIREIEILDELQQIRGPWSPFFNGQSYAAIRL